MARNDLAERTAQVVSQAILAAGESKKELSERTGIPYTTLHRKLIGGSDFTLPELYAIATVLGVAPRSLVPEEFYEPEAA